MVKILELKVFINYLVNGMRKKIKPMAKIY